MKRGLLLGGLVLIAGLLLWPHYSKSYVIAEYPHDHFWLKHNFPLDSSHTIASVDACRQAVAKTIHDGSMGYCSVRAQTLKNDGPMLKFSNVLIKVR